MIEVGDYIRIYGEIAKITKKWELDGRLYFSARYLDEKEYSPVNIDKITKHSKNIIDLIEVGDYVNGYPVRMIDNKLCNFDLNTMEWEELERIKLDGLIETIVTKENFESISYKV